MARAIEKPAKMIPNWIPVAPRVFVYIGRRGDIIPTPNIEENIERESMKNMVFLERNFIPPCILDGVRILYLSSPIYPMDG